MPRVNEKEFIMKYFYSEYLDHVYTLQDLDATGALEFYDPSPRSGLIVEKKIDLGYFNEESQAAGYLYGKYGGEAIVYNWRGEGECYLVLIMPEREGTWKIIGFDNLAEAIEEAEEHIEYYEPIENKIERFMNELPADFRDDVKAMVKPENNNSGNWYSFNILYKDCLVVDGVFILESDVLEKLEESIEIINTEVVFGSGIHIDSITKSKDNFERYYDVRFTDGNGNHVEELYHISGLLQGQPRNTLQDVIFDQIDIQSLKDEFMNFETIDFKGVEI